MKHASFSQKSDMRRGNGGSVRFLTSEIETQHPSPHVSIQTVGLCNAMKSTGRREQLDKAQPVSR
jgi:hypothetical protein